LSEDSNSERSIKKRSPLWYELPLLFSIIGGAIAYFKIRKDDPKKARNCLILGLLLIIFLFFYVGFQIIFGVENPMYIISSGSMTPVLQVFDLALVQGNDPFESVVVGDIIVFNRPAGQDRTIIARVVEIFPDEKPFSVRTKGDANPASIPGTDFPITENEYIGKVAIVIPQFGYVSRILSAPIIYIIQAIILAIPVIQHIKFRNEKDKN